MYWVIHNWLLWMSCFPEIWTILNHSDCVYLATGDSILSSSALLDLVQEPHPKQWPQVNYIEHTSVPPGPTEMSMPRFRFESVTVSCWICNWDMAAGLNGWSNARIYGFSNLLTRWKMESLFDSTVPSGQGKCSITSKECSSSSRRGVGMYAT